MRQSCCNCIVDNLEGDVFHAIHHVAMTEAIDQIVRVLGTNGLGSEGRTGISLLEPNWRVVLEYSGSFQNRRRRKRRG